MLRMNPKVNYGLRVGNVDNGETMHVGGRDLCEIPSSQICCEPKSALKYSLLKINLNKVINQNAYLRQGYYCKEGLW